MKKRRLLYLLPILALMVLIFCFSAQVADDSTTTSHGFCTAAAHLLIDNLETFDAGTQGRIIDGFSFIVRKAAHFCEYALLGALWYLWLRELKFAPFLALGASALYAVTDEIHQHFVPGRSCQLRDVLIDSGGAACGIFAAFVLVCVCYCIKRKEIVHWGRWQRD